MKEHLQQLQFDKELLDVNMKHSNVLLSKSVPTFYVKSLHGYLSMM